MKARNRKKNNPRARGKRTTVTFRVQSEVGRKNSKQIHETTCKISRRNSKIKYFAGGICPRTNYRKSKNDSRERSIYLPVFLRRKYRCAQASRKPPLPLRPQTSRHPPAVPPHTPSHPPAGPSQTPQEIHQNFPRGTKTRILSRDRRRRHQHNHQGCPSCGRRWTLLL